MCTLAVAFQADRRFPLVVAANRDERLGRPSEGWALRTLPGGALWIGPKDLEAGGTWAGLSGHGVFAGVTNHRTGEAPDRALRSRGELVALALAHATAAEARVALAAAAADRFNPFHLLVADAESAFTWWWDGARAGIDVLGPGLHVVTENAADERGPRGELVRARWPIDSAPARLRELLTIHSPRPEDPALGTATCLHLDPSYGTRSSFLLRLTLRLDASELLTADGRPCTTPYEDRGELLTLLARAA
ncbi:MAG TPA: NRDE family protein [Anaeromyxobacteraceae bacterium]|nr:NRDE family protein [Anaeromyxobacteraceae bacterium]